EKIHAEYVQAGAEVIETNTFAANRLKLRRVGLEHQLDELNRAGVEIARRAAGDRAYVVAAIGPAGAKMVGVPEPEPEELRAIFRDQAEVLVSAAPDAIILETFNTLSELEIALDVVRSLTDLPIIALAAFTGGGATGDGASPDDVAKS